MDIIQPIILGIIQGLGEFLPISSTAHLIIVPYFFNWSDPGLAFNVALHAGTLVALILYFWKDWKNIILSGFSKARFKNNENITNGGYYTQNPNLLWFVAIATIPGVLAGIFLESQAETVFRNPLLIAAALSLAGLILFLADKYAKKIKNLDKITLLDATIIGIFQAIAIIPGISRSGITITVGLFRGLNRVDAAKFSFLLSAPIILGATIFEFPNLLKSGMNLNIVLGILFSALSGYFAIKYLLKFVEKYSYQVFFWYRLGLALLIVFLYFYR